ncbi:ImmA/IrrE family metallo-endopeptidase [Listeria valentina]|uniref:ImmA/IrrE family metallo-endopeptidase n=1 Tax=Listeria valentina TaxID=2705293 RepID=UPI0014320A31|nr:ImmA/IrrE family metallo-endopeptidase [Listeria valentina]
MPFIYEPTSLEKHAENYLTSLKIFHPYQINIENICTLENLDYGLGKTSCYLVVNDYRFISINEQKNSKDQQFEFLHELSHNHFDHNLYTAQCIDLEKQARLFSLYLAIPLHMFRFINFNSQNIIKETSDLFNIPEDYTLERLQMIYERKISNSSIQNTIFFNHI